MARELASGNITVTEFCTETKDLEMFMTGLLIGFYGGDINVKTETGSYICRCQQDADPILFLICSLVYQETYADAPEISYGNMEQMTFLKSKTGSYVPTHSYWADTLDGSGELVGINFDVSDDYQYESCEVFDSYCDGEIPCSVCEGGKTIAYAPENECYDVVTCQDNDMGAFSFSYFTMNKPDPIIPDEPPSEDCVNDGRFVDEFCADLTVLEEDFTSSFIALADSNFDVDGFQCECTRNGMYRNITGMEIICSTKYAYPGEGGSPYAITFETSTNTETLWLKRKGNFMLPSKMQWCDGDYCETYDVALSQHNFASCNIDGCQASHCELCADRKSVGHSCSPESNFACDSEYKNKASFFAPYIDMELAIVQCTASPTASPTTATPSTSPTNSAMPTATFNPSSVASELPTMMMPSTIPSDGPSLVPTSSNNPPSPPPSGPSPAATETPTAGSFAKKVIGASTYIAYVFILTIGLL